MNKIEIVNDIVSFERVKKDLVIAHFSDIHFSKYMKEETLNNIVSKVRGINPNYIVITGDLIDYYDVVFEKNVIKIFVNFIANLGKITKTLISVGNHDVFYDSDINFFNKLNDIDNVYVLNNDIYQDEFVYICGFNMPNNYYYNINHCESVDVLLDHIGKYSKLLKHLPESKFKILLMHSPIYLTNDNVLKKLSEFNLLLSGHMHDGMVPNFLKIFFKKNLGIISPYRKLFPNFCRGRIDRYVKGNRITLIISGGITKLSKKSGKFLSELNFIYNKSINKIIITKRRGKYYE